MRSEKAVQDWINTSLALSFNNEKKTSEPDVMIDPSESPSHSNGKTVEDQNAEISRLSIPKNCRGNYILSNEILQQLDPYYTPTENLLAAANTQALYQAHLRAQMDQIGQQGMALPSITNQGTADSHPPSVHAPGASSPPTQQPILPQPLAPQVNYKKHPSYFPTHNFKFHNPGDLKHQVCPRIIRSSEYAPGNKLILSPEHQTPLFLLFRPIIRPPQLTFPCTQAPHQVQTLNITTPNPLVLMIFPFRTQSSHLISLLPSHTPPLINQPLVNNNFQNSNNRVHKVVRSVAPPFPNMPNIPLGQSFVPNMSHWRFPQHRPSLVNQDITTVINVAPNVQAHIASSVSNFPQQIYSNSPRLIERQSPSGTHQENPIATTSNIVLGLATPVFQPTYPYVGPTLLSWSSPQVSALAPPIPDNASLIENWLMQ